MEAVQAKFSRAGQRKDAEAQTSPLKSFGIIGLNFLGRRLSLYAPFHE